MPTATADVSAPSPLDRAHTTLDAWRENDRAERASNTENARRLVLAATRVECEVAIRLDAELQRSADAPTDADREHAENRIRAHIIANLRRAYPDLAGQLEDESALAAAIEVTGVSRARQAELKQAITECLALHRLYDERDGREKECTDAGNARGRFRAEMEAEKKRRAVAHAVALTRYHEALAAPKRICKVAALCPELRWEGDPPRPSSGLFD